MSDNTATTETSEAKQSSWVKLLVEFGPLMVFFISYKYGKNIIDLLAGFSFDIEPSDTNSLFVATAVFMLSMTAAMLFGYFKMGHISAMQKFTFVIVMVMGGLTLYLQNEIFVKMKPSLIYGVFSIILLFGLWRDKLYLKAVMQMAFELEDHVWRKLTKAYILFFISLIVANELIWRNFDNDTWVNFKTFGLTGALFIFIIGQSLFLVKYLPQDEE
ncbi:septation protein IspZ [Kordiimonas sp. SCSIO 12603]|uniref:inner membrane-spanning protein YciB n=1 Tax=Kordiimonas sp. SCSIO 12603 TaxID=2829596 RepID=UPI0021024A85|nr:inner membrane-spanning protein YciB [Kordiimonas sp. SCSIO 12603]UTW59254.1 septation protein IspZ [Kordiimonas sp. SCSIO 12603]